MRTVIVLCVALAIAFPADALFLSTITGAITSVTNAVTGAITSVTDTISNTIDTIQTGIEIATIGGQFLWDNALQPSLQILIDSNFINNTT